jgi:Tfp pilus assembly protein PilO
MPEKQKLDVKFKLLIVLVILVIFVPYFLFVLKPKYEQVSLKRNELKNKEEQLENLKKYRIDVQKLIENYKAIDPKDVEAIIAALPSEDDMPGLFVQLETIALASGLNLLGIDITEKKEAMTIGGINVKEMDISANLSGGEYENFKKFLGEIESNLRIFDLASVSYAPEAATYTVNLKTYYKP